MTISGFVAYVKQIWKNKPDTSTPLSAARLTHMENGIEGTSDAIAKIAAAVVNQIVNDPNKIASMAALYSVNQQLVQLNSEFSAIETDVAAIETDVAAIETDVAAIETDVAAIETDIAVKVRTNYNANNETSRYAYYRTGCTNVPDNYIFIITMIYGADAAQIGIRISSTTSNMKLYIRSRGDNTWTNWVAK